VGTRELDPDKLGELIAKAYRRFYFRSRYVLARMKKLRSPHQIARAGRGLLSALRYAGVSR
jgi:hypothetical protein